MLLLLLVMITIVLFAIPRFFQCLEHHADILVELGHARAVKALLRDHVTAFLLQARPA
jgi:hypothetical protein